MNLIPISVYLLFVFAALVSGCGVHDNQSTKIGPCPSTPNCVTSIGNATDAGIEPLVYEGHDAQAKDVAWKVLLDALGKEKRVRIINDTGVYLHAECRTFLGFVDDLEFMAEPADGLIHVRSASRVGVWDFGVNGRRVERIRERFVRAE